MRRKLQLPKSIRAISFFRFYLLALFFVLFAILSQPFIAEQNSVYAETSPKLSVSKSRYDFGTVAEGAVVTHTFVIRNNGTADLIIRDIQPACGCTAAVLKSDVVTPGAFTELSVNYSTGGFSGYKIRPIRIYTNDPKRSSLVLSLAGTVESQVQVSPLRLNLGALSSGRGAVEVVTVSSSLDSFEIKEIHVDDELLSVSRLTSKDASSLRIEVRLSGKAPIGVFRSSVELLTNRPGMPYITIPVFAKVLADYQPVPSTVSFGVLSASQEQNSSLEVVLSNTSAEAIEILSSESSDPSLITEIIEEKTGFRYRIKTKLSNPPDGFFKAQITLLTNNDDPNQREIIIPVYAVVSDESIEDLL